MGHADQAGEPAIWGKDGTSAPDLAGIEVAVTDMDGTFLDPDHRAPPENLAAIEELEAAGLKMVFATGRNRSSAQARLRSLNLSRRAGVYLNGAINYNSLGAVIHERTVPRDIVADVLRFVKEQEGKFTAVLCHGDDHAVPDLGETWALHLHKDYADPYPKCFGGYDVAIEKFSSPAGGEPKDESRNHRQDSGCCMAGWTELLSRLTGSSWHRFSEPHLLHVVGKKDDLDAVQASLEKTCAGRVRCSRALLTCITLLNPQCSKADGLGPVLRELGTSPENAIAFGDAGNDIEMLKAVRVGVAMSNAMDMVRDSVAWTCRSNRDHGVGRALREVVRFARDGDKAGTM